MTASKIISILSLFPSYLVMPYMFTDLSKVRGPLSEDKVQFLIYQTLCGLRVSPEVLLEKCIQLHYIMKCEVQSKALCCLIARYCLDTLSGLLTGPNVVIRRVM